MIKDNYTLFCEQLQEVVKKYPSLAIRIDNDGRSFLKGILDIPYSNGEIAGSFLIEIHVSKEFPYRFPLLYEVGGDIPNEVDWHKNPKDETCCITVYPEEILKCLKGISVARYIKEHAMPYLANQLYRKKTNKYKNGEYSHGYLGLKEYYTSLFGTEIYSLWGTYYKAAFTSSNLRHKETDLCFCRSGKVFKKCHGKVFQLLRLIGKENVNIHINYILESEKKAIHRVV